MYGRDEEGQQFGIYLFGLVGDLFETGARRDGQQGLRDLQRSLRGCNRVLMDRKLTVDNLHMAPREAGLAASIRIKSLRQN